MITSTGNQKIKEIIQFQKKSKARNQAGIFLVEGLRMIQEVPKERLEKLYVSEGFYKKYQKELQREGLTEGRMPEIVSDHVFAAMSDTKTPQGVLGVVRRAEYDLKTLLASESPFLMILDNLQDPGNLGTIFRTAEAAGVTGIVMSKDCVDIYNPKTIRSTMGAIYRMPFFIAENLPEMIEKIKQEKIGVYAAHLDGTNTYDQENYRQGCAFLIGNEGNGLRSEVAECADRWIRIPMAGQVESLNAAVAASVLMFEVSRQRRNERTP